MIKLVDIIAKSLTNIQYLVKKILFFFCISFFLTSCGFHLRGYNSSNLLPPPLHRLYIKTADPFGELTRELVQSLKAYDVCLVSCPNEASTILDIQSENINQILLSVSGTEQTRQYNLGLCVTYQVTDNKGCVLIPSQTVKESRTLTIQSNQILGGSNEANLMYSQMRPALVYDIIMHLSSRRAACLLMHPISHEN